MLKIPKHCLANILGSKALNFVSESVLGAPSMALIVTLGDDI